MRWRRLFIRANPARLATWLLALWKLVKHPDTPRGVRWLAVAVVAYAVSPIDLIPDFIPVIGLLDDLILVPLGVALVVRLAPPALWAACLAEAELGAQKLPRLIWGAVAVIAIWLVLLALFVAWIVSLMKGSL